MNTKLTTSITTNIGLTRKIKILIFTSGMYCLCPWNGCNITRALVNVTTVVVHISLLKYTVT